MRYAVIVEQAQSNFSAYVPDFPYCATTGKTIAEIQQNIREAIQFHLEGLRENGLPTPEPSAIVEYCEFAA